MQEYLGHRSLRLNNEECNQLYTDSILSNYNFLENEYLYVEPLEEGGQGDYFQFRDSRLQRIKYPILTSTYTGSYKPRNIQQVFAFDMLKDKQTTIKLITGKWGSGKSLALIVAALEVLEKGEYDKIIWVRNNVQVKDTDQLGALPGSEFDKLLPYLGPMVDHVGGQEGINLLVSRNKLEVIPLGFLRGRSIRKSIILSSEAENLTKEHLQLLMGRVDEGSSLWIDADLKQRDRMVFEKSAGIETMIERLKGEALFGYVHLLKSERSETAKLADKLN